MRILILFCLVFAACTRPGFRPGVGPRESRSLLIDDVTVVSPERAAPLEHASVLIEDGKIVAVGQAGKLPATSDTGVISGKGKYLIPGLIDAHVHLASVPGLSLDQKLRDESLIPKYFEQLPRSYLYFGYTTLLDLAAARPQVLADFRTSPIHPDLFDCGPPVPVLGGYPMAFLPPEARKKVFINYVERGTKGHSVADVIGRVRAVGGICVKTYWEKGWGKKMHFNVPSDMTLREIAQKAHEAGLFTLVHANSIEAQEHVVGTGNDIFAHSAWNWGELKNAPGIPPRLKKILDQVIARKMGYELTMQVIGGTQALADPAFLDDPQLLKVLPKGMVDFYKSKEGKWFKDTIEKDEDVTLSMETHQPILSKISRVAKYMADHGGNLVFGTDTPSAPTYGNPPGYNGYLEMKRWVSSGVPLSKLFYSATLGAARAIRQETSIGSVEAGKRANLLLLDANPLETVEAYDRIDTVLLGGRAVARKELAAGR